MTPTNQIMHQVRALPKSPGVYIMHNDKDTIIYIGKANQLQTRVRSYFGSGRSLEPKVRALAADVVRIEHIVTRSEAEALNLEATLIKKHRPHYNVRLKDDKHYPYLKIDTQSPWPRVQIARKVDHDEAKYFGPYASAGSVRQALDVSKKLFPWRSCSKEITGTDPRPCLDYFIKRCIAPCTSYCSPKEYEDVIQNTILFLEGKSDQVKQHVEDEMLKASDQLDFERAANLRDQLQSIKNVVDNKKTTLTQSMDADVFALARDSNEACIQAFFIRGLSVADTDSFIIDGTKGNSDAHIMSAFLGQYYESATYIPRRILLNVDTDEKKQIEIMLSARRTYQVRILIPERGEKKSLVKLTEKNAWESLHMYHAQWIANEDKTSKALTMIQQQLGLAEVPNRIECYDISTNQGVDTVASMVVFKNGQPATSEYRRFKIKTVVGQDDFASMREVLNRRFKHLKQDGSPSTPLGKETVTNKVPSAWDEIPDLVIIDGGKGQLSVAIDVLRDLGRAEIPLCGLAKREEELFVKDFSEPILLPRNSEALYLVQRIRDEAHRFAITYHRRLRRKNSIKSVLDTVPGVGPKRKKALLRKFGNVKTIKEATVEDIAATIGFTEKLARLIKQSI